jgi:hypothetical protein
MEGSFSNVRQRDDAEENEADDHEDEATVDWVVQRIEGAGGLELMAAGWTGGGLFRDRLTAGGTAYEQDWVAHGVLLLSP